MKTINIFYWIVTGLLLALMLFSAVMSFMPPTPDSTAMIKHIGFPAYIMKFLAVLKILGVIALLVPGFVRLKEWAYAGFTFDLLGATYASIAVGDPISKWFMMIIFLAMLAISYILWRKRIQLKANVPFNVAS